jgi:biopolymer transport protein ExbD
MAKRPTKMVDDSGAHDLSIDLKPFINFLVVLVPVLMLSAEFAKIAIINLKLPEGRGSSPSIKQTKAPEQDDSDKLLLTMIITDSVVTLGAKGGFLPSMFYKEYHKYVARDDRTVEITVEYDPSNPNKPVINPKTKKPFHITERQEILLYVTDENRNIINCVYTKNGEMVTDVAGNALKEVPKMGDTIFLLTNPRRMVVVTNPSQYILRPLLAYDEMKNRLMKIKQRYPDVADANDIILAAENEVAYDKIVQLMDVARAAEFPNIAISKLRS